METVTITLERYNLLNDELRELKEQKTKEPYVVIYNYINMAQIKNPTDIQRQLAEQLNVLTTELREIKSMPLPRLLFRKKTVNDLL